ncbi:unnamed protein product [Linum tenue]|uniref:Bifunctional inhibitor/plant lipid transfer protein/seed storage helical domain-containing protein n=1 Tax=Linum tenue TaxID=586396 RepID=A0AAV0IJX1_9ROSI|nr:unnamed protein product [Linum tenue]
MSRRSPAAFAAAILLAIISAVSAQTTMAPGPAPYYNPTMGPASPGSSGGGGGGEMAPAPAVDCMTQLFNLSDCLSYVTTGSNLTKPDKPCCPELAGLVDSNPICLCSLLTLNASDYGFDIDRKRALGLPSACSVATPPVSLCPGIGGSPTGAPSPSQGGGGAAVDAPAGGPVMGPSPSSSENGGTGTGPSGHGSPTASPRLSTHLLFTTTTLFLLFSTSFFHSH